MKMTENRKHKEKTRAVLITAVLLVVLSALAVVILLNSHGRTKPAHAASGPVPNSQVISSITVGTPSAASTICYIQPSNRSDRKQVYLGNNYTTTAQSANLSNEVIDGFTVYTIKYNDGHVEYKNHATSVTTDKGLTIGRGGREKVTINYTLHKCTGYTKSINAYGQWTSYYTTEDSTPLGAISVTFVDTGKLELGWSNGANMSKKSISATFKQISGASVNGSYSLNGSSNMSYSSGSELNAEGKYTVTATITDSFGACDQTSITGLIDKTPPKINCAEYTCNPFNVSASDSASGMDKLEIQVDGTWQPYSGKITDNGSYTFRATDKCGNTSEKTAVLYRTETFGNLVQIRDGFKVNSWYTVNLPARIFTTPSKDVAGRYSFEEYADALSFAEEKEREFRVSPVQGGFMYVSAANETIAQKYSDETSLNGVIEHYAKGYISSRQTASANGSDRLYTEPMSLTRNSPPLPAYLNAYSDRERYYAKSSTVWRSPADMYGLKYLKEMPYNVTATYLGDDVAVEPIDYDVPKNTPLKTALGSYRQGWYCITESDAAGNIQTYLIYSDCENPTIQAQAERGSSSETVTVDYSYTRNNTMYFTRFDINRLADNADEYVTLKVERGSNAYYFTQADELPTLGSGDYPAGKYTLTVYDRSLNSLGFELYIAGDPPIMKHSSLDADKPECKLTFSCADRNCVITELELYKIDGNGQRKPLTADDVGNAVNAQPLSYTLKVGGKYGATVKDNFGRVTEFEPVFYLNGLPQATLEGVKNGGRTNKNVTATFSTDAEAELYILGAGGARTLFFDYTVQAGAGSTSYLITASAATSHEYLLFLKNAAEPSLFIEYTFEIDTVLPDFRITDVDGNVIQPDGATNKPFKLAWDEANVTVRLRTASGFLTGARYDMNTVLTVPTLYYFTIRDDVGNSAEFTVLLDNSVSYSLSEHGSEHDGALYFSKPVSFTVNEPISAFRVENADGYSIDNGDTLTRDGKYVITASDNYGNTVTLILVLDFTPPKLEAEGLSGVLSKDTVTVTASDYDYLYLTDRNGNKIRDIENGATFSEAGMYYITARDYAGNAATISFGIDTGVEYRLSVPIGAVTTEKVVLSADEDVTVTGMRDGEELEENTLEFIDSGRYELQITDTLGNVSFCVFVIVPGKAQTYSIELPTGTAVRSATLNGEAVELKSDGTLELELTGKYVITLDCGGTEYMLEPEADSAPPVVTLEKDKSAVKIAAVDKTDVTLELTLDGKEITGRIGQTLEEDGHYVLVVTDSLGNSAVYEWDIPYRLNGWAIAAIVVGSAALIVILVFIIRARRKPRVV